uniref:Uncharacterized protein n=1 Tax=Streptomyces sp. NBC_00049 TaxID=2903617 RepID=A0AAU2JMQ6_9ACTN
MSSRPSAFEERLKAELLAIAADRPEGTAIAPRSRARRLRVPLALGAVAATVAGLIALPVLGDSGGSSPAYAVTKDSDGTIWIEVRQPLDALPGLERELRTLGFSVVTVPMKRGCRQFPEWHHGPNLESGPVVLKDGGFTLKVNSETVPAGYTIVIQKPDEQEPLRDRRVDFDVIETSKVPPCVPVHITRLDLVLTDPAEFSPPTR